MNDHIPVSSYNLSFKRTIAGLAACFLLFSVGGSVCFADTVKLKSGRVLEGWITRITTDGLTVQTEKGLIGANFSLIKSIEESSGKDANSGYVEEAKKYWQQSRKDKSGAVKKDRIQIEVGSQAIEDDDASVEVQYLDRNQMDAARVAAVRQIVSKKVEIYTTSWCPQCTNLRRLLNNLSVSYREYDVEKNSHGKEAYRKFGGPGVPVLVIDGKVALVGFNDSTVRDLFKKQK